MQAGSYGYNNPELVFNREAAQLITIPAVPSHSFSPNSNWEQRRQTDTNAIDESNGVQSLPPLLLKFTMEVETIFIVIKLDPGLLIPAGQLLQ